MPRLKSTYLPLLHRVEQYLIAHPGCIAPDIIAALATDKQTVYSTLTSLRKAGKARRLPRYRAQPRQRWEAGAEAGVDPSRVIELAGEPRQATVKDWQPPKLVQQTWYSALG